MSKFTKIFKSNNQRQNLQDWYMQFSRTIPQKNYQLAIIVVVSGVHQSNNQSNNQTTGTYYLLLYVQKETKDNFQYSTRLIYSRPTEIEIDRSSFLLFNLSSLIHSFESILSVNARQSTIIRIAYQISYLYHASEITFGNFHPFRKYPITHGLSWIRRQSQPQRWI